ncbi:hypothetical protein GOP47_0010922 [Adiantum capillus-veneris]|uniref:F-box domain-containing protein n=1 Tax=Adiantum capillus-veneris TaxID=13818 RepID=A0A9D4UVZ9_ADICA|nr:hypothetical protein GOP47_0010922 [Adiantum capillus-veneris]
MACEGELLPGLPDEVALRCLATLPLDALARCRSLSRSWASALSLPLPSRPPLPFACLCTAHVNSRRESFWTWLFLTPSHHSRPHIVPFYRFPSPPRPTRLHALSSQTQVITTGTNLLLVRSRLELTDRADRLWLRGNGKVAGLLIGGNDASAPGALQGFDVWQMKWCREINRVVPCMHVDRWGFATAHVGMHVYVAGGEGPAAARSAERLNMETGLWEMLPEMRYERSVNPAGFVLGGCFYVAGGEFQPTACTEGRGLSQSGEYYDPKKGVWTLVEGMWPEELWGYGEGDPNVVVVKDVAYALSHGPSTRSTEVMMLSVVRGQKWEVRGRLPHVPGFDLVEGSFLHLVSVNDDELWVVISGMADRPWLVYACKPHLSADDGLLNWEHRPFTIPLSIPYFVLASVGIHI